MLLTERWLARVKQIFDEIEATGYPITKVVPIVAYEWDDDASIADNNTSAFNYRHVIGPGQDDPQIVPSLLWARDRLEPEDQPIRGGRWIEFPAL